MMLSRREQNGGRYIVVPFFPIAFFAAKSVGAEVETIGRCSCARVAVVEKDFFFLSHSLLTVFSLLTTSQ